MIRIGYLIGAQVAEPERFTPARTRNPLNNVHWMEQVASCRRGRAGGHRIPARAPDLGRAAASAADRVGARAHGIAATGVQPDSKVRSGRPQASFTCRRKTHDRPVGAASTNDPVRWSLAVTISGSPLCGRRQRGPDGRCVSTSARRPRDSARRGSRGRRADLRRRFDPAGSGLVKFFDSSGEASAVRAVSRHGAVAGQDLPLQMLPGMAAEESCADPWPWHRVDISLFRYSPAATCAIWRQAERPAHRWQRVLPCRYQSKSWKLKYFVYRR